MPRSCPLPRVVPDNGRFNSGLDPQDANHLLPGNTPEVQLGSAKQTIDDQEVTANAEADELQLAIGPEHEERGNSPLAMQRGKTTQTRRSSSKTEIGRYGGLSHCSPSR